ncbi:hypothetical protein CAI21_21575, partial [Alkalilimnicola ehrlichii]
MIGMTLYQLSDQYKQAYDVLSQDENLPAEVFNDTMEGLAGDIEAKATNVAAFIGNLEASVGAMKEAEKRIAQRRKTAEERVKWLKNYLLTNMQACGIKRIDAPEYSIRLQKNPTSVQISDAEAVPANFYRQPPPEIDKQAVKD